MKKLLLLFVLALGMSLTANAQAVTPEAAANKFLTATINGDADYVFNAGFSEKSAEENYNEFVQASEAFGQVVAGGGTIQVGEVLVEGDIALAEIQVVMQGNVVSSTPMRLVKAEGVWLVDLDFEAQE